MGRAPSLRVIRSHDGNALIESGPPLSVPGVKRRGDSGETVSHTTPGASDVPRTLRIARGATEPTNGLAQAYVATPLIFTHNPS